MTGRKVQTPKRTGKVSRAKARKAVKAVAEKVGRPSKYKNEYVAQLIEHFNVSPFDVLTGDDGKPLLNKAGQPLMKACEFPTKESFACEIGVHRDTLHEWANARDGEGDSTVLRYPEFSDAYKRAEMFQYKILTQCGLAGVFQGNFAIFTAKNVLGMRDTVDIAATVTIQDWRDQLYGKDK